MIVIIAALSLCLALGSFHGKRTSDYRLKMADAIMNSTPDSALALLKTINRDSLDEELQAWHALLYTKATDKCYRPIADDSLISRAVDYYTGRGDSLEVQSLFYQGYYYSTHKVADTALVVLSRAYETALSAHDCFYAGMSAREISNVYRRLLMISEGLKWARIAKQLFYKGGKTLHASWMDDIIANCLIFIGDYEAAGRLLDSMSHIGLYADRNFHCNTLLNKVDLAMQLDAFEEALALYDSLAINKHEFKAHDRLNQAKASLMTGRYRQADNFFGRAFSLTMSNADSLYACKLSSLVAANQQDYLKAYDLSCAFADDLMKSDGRRLTNPQTILLTDNYRLKAENHRRQAQRNHNAVIVLIASCVLMAIFIIMLWYIYRSRLACKRLEVEKLMAESQTLRDDLSLSNCRVDEMERNGATMKQAICDMAAEYDMEIRGLFTRHLDLINNMYDIWYHNKDNTSRSNRFYKEIISMLEKMGQIKVIQDLAEIINRYDDMWVDRFRKGYPDLREVEYQLAIYLYVGFRPSTIAVLTEREHTSSVHAAKHKLKQKLQEQNPNAYEQLASRLF